MDENTPDPIQSAGLFEGDIAGINHTSFFPVSIALILTEDILFLFTLAICSWYLVIKQ